MTVRLLSPQQEEILALLARHPDEKVVVLIKLTETLAVARYFPDIQC